MKPPVKQLDKIEARRKQPAIIATLPSSKVEISPNELLDYFIAAIRLGSIPQDHKLYEVFLQAEEDKDQGQILLLRLATDLEEHGKVEAMPVLEGKRMIMFIAPKKKK